MDKRKLNALIDLIDDPDELVHGLVEKELLKENHRIIPALEKKWELSLDESSQERIENLIQSLQFKQNKKLLKKWVGSPRHDLLSGFLLVDSFQYPDLNQLKIHLKIEKLRESIWLELSDSLTILEKTTILNHFIFNVNGYSINHNNIHSPQNCFLNQVLDTKQGNPFSISALYMIVARQLGFPVYFIDFPKNPLIAIADTDLAQKVHGDARETDVLFYINPSNKGSITSRKEIEYHLRKNKYSPLQLYAEPKTDLFFIQKLFESLHESYRSVGSHEKEEDVKSLLGFFH